MRISELVSGVSSLTIVCKVARNSDPKAVSRENVLYKHKSERRTERRIKHAFRPTIVAIIQNCFKQQNNSTVYTNNKHIKRAFRNRQTSVTRKCDRTNTNEKSSPIKHFFFRFARTVRKGNVAIHTVQESIYTIFGQCMFEPVKRKKAVDYSGPNV